MKKKPRNIFALASLAGVMLMAACAPGSAASTLPSGGEIFKPPTQPAAQKPAGSAIEATVEAKPTPPCVNGLAFLSDITIPDGAVLAPGTAAEKTWEVENAGTCGWDAGYSLRHVGGSNLGIENGLPLYPARSGTRARISIQFTVPSESGTILSAWRAYAPDGQPFGDPIYLQINISNSQP